MKHFIFEIGFAFGGVGANDPATDSGETKIEIAAPSLRCAIATLETTAGVTNVMTVENARSGVAHRLTLRF